MTREPIGREPLWSDERIDQDFDRRVWRSRHASGSEAQLLCREMRDDYEAERAALLAQASDVADILEGLSGYARDSARDQLGMDSDTILDLTARAALLLDALKQYRPGAKDVQP